MSTNDKLKKINTPQLGQGYGRDIRITFENIDDNFGVLSNRDFMKGDAGDSLISMNIPVSDIYQINGTSIVSKSLSITIDDQEYDVDTNFITQGLLGAFIELKTSLLENITSEEENPTVNNTDSDVLFAMRNLCSGSNNYNILFNFTLPTSPDTPIDSNYIKSIIPLIYIDQRFWINPAQSGDVQVDLSCTITYGDKYTVNNDNDNVKKWECVQNFPSLYYRQGEGEENPSGIYWVINGNRTSIPASGPKGIDGKAGVVLIGLAASLPDGWPTINETKTVVISQILDTNTDSGDVNGRWINAKQFVDDHGGNVIGAPIIVLPPKGQTPPAAPPSNPVSPQFSYFISYLEYSNNVVSVQVDYNNIMYVQMTEYLFKSVMNNRVIVQDESNQTPSTETALYLDGYTIRDDPSSSNDTNGYVIHARKNSVPENTFSIGRSNNITNNVIIEDTGSKYNFRISGDVSVQEGSSNIVSYANGAHAEGSGSKATAAAAHAEGNSTEASGASSHAEGSGSKATASYAHAEGQSTKAYATASHAEGQSTEASGTSSHAEGSGSKATAAEAHAEGYNTNASKDAAHAEGDSTTASGASSHAEGQSNEASGESSHAEGYDTNASDAYSHAEGQSTEASGESSHAEGNSTTASGASSHAEGNSTTASGENSHTEGNSTTAAGSCSHAEGISTMAGDKNIIKIKLNDGNTENRLKDNVTFVDPYTRASQTRPKFLTINNNSVKTATANYRHALNYPNTNSSGLCNGWSNQTLIIENTSDNTIVGKYLINTAFRNVININNNITFDGSKKPADYGYPVDENQKNFTMVNFFSTSDYRTYLSSPFTSDIQNGVFILNFITFISGTGYYAIDLFTGDNLNYSELLNKLKTSGTTIYLLYDFNKSTISGDDKAYTYFKSNDNNIIFGYAEGAHTEGLSSKAITTAAHAEGTDTTAEGDSSHAEGHTSYAKGYASHTEGQSTAFGPYSHAEGYWATAEGYASHAEGQSTSASGKSSHAEGQSTSASGKSSHAEGDNTRAYGPYSHAEGQGAEAFGTGAHAEGESSWASGSYSHAEGNGIAFGAYSHAEGHSSDFDIANRFVDGVNPKEWTRAASIYEIINSSRRTVAQYFGFDNSEYFRNGGITTYPTGPHVPGYRVKDTSENDEYHQSMFIMRPEIFTGSTPDGKIVLVIPYNMPDSYDSNADWRDFTNNNIWIGQKISITFEQITYKRHAEETVGENVYAAGTPVYLVDAPYYKINSLTPQKSWSRTIENVKIVGVYKYTTDNYIALLTDTVFASISQNDNMESLNDNPLKGAYDWRDVNLCAISITSNDSGARGNWSHTEGHGCNAEGDASHAEGYYTETINEGEHACGVLNETGYMVSSGDYYYVRYDHVSDIADRIIFSVGSGDPVNGRRQNGLIVTQGGGVYVLVESNKETQREIARYKKLNTELS